MLSTFLNQLHLKTALKRKNTQTHIHVSADDKTKTISCHFECKSLENHSTYSGWAAIILYLCRVCFNQSTIKRIQWNDLIVIKKRMLPQSSPRSIAISLQSSWAKIMTSLLIMDNIFTVLTVSIRFFSHAKQSKRNWM